MVGEVNAIGLFAFPFVFFVVAHYVIKFLDGDGHDGPEGPGANSGLGGY